MIIDFFLDHPGWGFIATLAIVVGLLMISADHDNKIFERNMAQCLADGRKEYECRALLENHREIIPMPIIIPMGGR